MRDRTKATLHTLSAHITHLNQTLATTTASLESEIASLKEENRRLRAQVEESRFVGSELCLENFRFPECVGGALSCLPIPRPLSFPAPTTGNSGMGRGGEVGGGEKGIVVKEVFEAIPMTCPSTCLSDRILQNYIDARRAGISDFSNQTTGEGEQHPAWLPDINALLTPNKPKPSVDERSVSTVVSDILLSYHEINTLPRKVAVLYIMYKLLNWLIYRTQSTYDQMPGWLRPVASQINTPHPAWIDRIPWPNARTYLITHPHITFDDFAMVYSSSFDVSWPYNPSHIIGSTNCTHASGDEDFSDGNDGISLNPVYEQHLRQLKNWTVGEKFRRKFPELSGIIDQDSILDFWP